MSHLFNRARLLYRVGLLLGAAILTLFLGAWLINMADPYRIVTENLIHQVAAEPQRTAHLNEYSTISIQIRKSLPTENASAWSDWLDSKNVTTPIDWIPFRTNVRLVANRVETAVHKIAEFDDDLETIEAAKALSRNLARLQYYDLDSGDVMLADLYQQSTAVSRRLSNLSEGLEDVATAVANVTTFPDVGAVQQELLNARNTATSIAAVDDGLFYWVIPQGAVTDFVQLADFVNWSIDSWQGLPTSMRATQRPIAKDVTWLDGFEQDYRVAKVFNDRWHFDTLRRLTRFLAEFNQPLLLGVIINLLLAIVGWVASIDQPLARHSEAYPMFAKLNLYLILRWPDGPEEYQILSQTDELTIGNIVIRRARVRYYLELIDNAFPTQLNGNSICGARILHDGDVLQIGELQTTFQLAA